MAKREKKRQPYNPNDRAPDESIRHALSSRVDSSGRMHVVRDPLDFYRDCGQLDMKDARRNAILWQAGDRYRTVHRAAGLGGISAVDYGRGHGGSGDPAYGMPVTQAAMDARREFRSAQERLQDGLGKLYGGIVYAVLIDGEKIEDVAPVSHVGARERRMFGLEFLRVGLDLLAVHWGLLKAGGGH